MLNQLAPILLLGIALESVWLALTALGSIRENPAPVLALIMLALMLCLWAFFRLPLKTPSAVIAMLGFALLFRITLLPTSPSASEDVYRYLWDAKLSATGIGPYRYRPDARELEGHRDLTIYPNLNSKSYVTAYPPLSQILFRLSYETFGTSVIAMKAIFSGLEFGTLLLAWRLLLAFGLRLDTLYLLGWNPFFIFEFSHAGHSDSGMMFFVLLSVYFLHRSRRVWGMLSYAGAVLMKLHPALWFPLYFRRTGWKGALAAATAGIILISMYFTPKTGLQYLDSLKLYLKLFEFNASIHYLLRFIGREVFNQAWDQVTGPYLGFALLVIVAIIGLRFPLRSEKDLLHAGFWIMTADLCLATTVHPWYLSWAALALPFFPYAFMIYWTSASALSYVAYAYRPVYEPTWVLLIEYLPMYGLMAWEIYRGQPLLSTWLNRKRG